MPRSPTLRAAIAFICLSAWLVLTFSGVILGKAVYLLLVAAFVFFPWKWLRKPVPAGEHPAEGGSESSPSDAG